MAATNWQPPQWPPPVGVGADDDPPWQRLWDWTEPTRTGLLHAVQGDQAPAARWDPDAEQRGRQAVEAQRWDPGLRMQQFGQQFSQDPALATLGLAGDVMQQTRVPLGMIQGAVQAGLEARTGRSLAGTVDQGPFGQRENPPVRNILDPAEARARFEALTPAPVGLVEDLLLGGSLKLPGLAASGVKAGLSAAGRDLLPQGGELLPLAGTRAAGIAQQAAGMLGSRTAAGLVGAEAARETWGHTEDQPLPQRIGETALAGLSGFGLAHFMGGALRTRASRAVGEIGTVPAAELPEDASPELRSLVEGQARGATQARQGGLPGQRQSVGGAIQEGVDTLRQAFTDRLARPETIQNALEKMGGPLPEGQQFYPLMRVAAGAKGAGLQFIRDEIEPVVQRIGFTTKEQIPIFERQSLLRMAVSEAERPDPMAIIPQVLTKGKADPVKAQRLLTEHEAMVREMYPHDPAFVDRMNTGVDELTQAYNKAIGVLRDNGVISDEVYQTSVDRHAVYSVLRNYDSAVDAIGAKSLPQEMTVTNQGIAFMPQHTTEQPSLTMEDQLRRIPRLFELAAKNRAMNAMDAAMEQMARDNPAWGDYWQPNVPKRIGASLVPNAKVPPGMGRVAFFKDGEYVERLTDAPLAHALSGIGAPELGTIARIAARATEPFRLGITALNFGFIYGHANRSFQLAGENTPAGLAWNLTKNMGAYTMDMIADGADAWLTKNQGHPVVQQLPIRIADSVARALGGDPEVPRAIRRAGGGYSSIMEELRTPGSAAQVLGLPGAESGSLLGIPRGRGLPVIGGVLGTTEDVAHALTYWADQVPRGAMWKTATDASITGVKRTLMTREISIDFQKAGQVTRTLNAFIPLLNAREQGWLTSLKGAWEDPQRFAFRASTFVAMPTIAAYTYNRLNYPDLYDKIPIEDRDRYFNIITGRHSDPQNGDTPIRFRIVKSPAVQLIASPIEHFLDANYHVRLGQQEIDPIHRTARSGEEMWLSRLAMALPWEPHPDQMTNPLNHGMAALTMNPSAGVVAEMYANKDYFTGRPIIPEDERILPQQYQYTPRTSAAAKGLAKAGLSGGLAPAQIDYLVGGWGGSYAMNWMYMGDRVLGALQGAGLIGPHDFADQVGAPAGALQGALAPKSQPDLFKPQSAEDLGLGPNAPQTEIWRHLGAVARPDDRPWWQVFIPRIFSQSGGADTISARVEHLGPHEQEVWHQTRAMNEAYALRRMSINEDLQRMYQEGGKLTPAELRKREGDMFSAMHDAWETLHGQYPLALTETRDKDEFMKQIPGFTSEALQQSLPQLPSGVTAEQLRQRWMAPGGQDLSQLNPFQRATLQGQELARMSQETQLPTSVLKWHIGAAVFDKELPGLPVPALDLERAFNAYRAPRGPDGQPLDPVTTPSRVWTQAKRDTLTQLAQEMHLPEQDLAQWIANRHTASAETNPLQQSRVRAEAMASDLHDPAQTPRFLRTDGTPFGDPADWDRMEAELTQRKQQMAARKIPRDRWPATLRLLDDTWHNGEVAQVKQMSQDPRTADYERWYGTGRDIPTEKWEQYQTGQTPKYRNATPEQALKYDMTLRLYRALPVNSRTRSALRPVVRALQKRATPGWAALMKLDEEDASDTA